jgi:nucleolar pre-ribosomal-associated protein 2
MQFVLSAYIQLQLEMRMLPEVREKLVLGIYALFDATTPELRQAVSEGLDANGRAVFGGLYRDWKRFGKWEGS